MRFLAVVLGAAIAACGGGGGTTTAPQGGATGAATTAPAAATPTTPAPAAPTAAPTARPPAFLDLVGAAKSATYKVTYRWTGTSGGQTIAAEQTWYVMGARSRFEFSTPEGKLSVFDLPEGSFMCVAAGAYGPEVTCLGTPKDAALQGNQGAAFTLQVEERPDQFDPTYEGARTIAGQGAQCFSLQGRSGAGLAGLDSGRMCYAPNGVPLLMQSKGQGYDMTFEATAYSTSVSEADFKLPAVPVKLGAP